METTASEQGKLFFEAGTTSLFYFVLCSESYGLLRMAIAIWPDLLANLVALRSTPTRYTHFLLLPGCLTCPVITLDIWEELGSQEKGGVGEQSLFSFAYSCSDRWLVQREPVY